MIKTTKIPPAEMINKDRLSVVASKLDQVPGLSSLQLYGLQLVFRNKLAKLLGASTLLRLLSQIKVELL